MLKAIVVGSLLGCSILVSPLSASAQSSAPAPSAQPAPQPAPAGDVSQAEVEKFASTVKQFQTIQEEAQQQADQILASEDLSPERFSQILQSQRNPQTQPSPEVTDAERQNFDQAMEKLAELQNATRERMDQTLQSEGLPRERFTQILGMVRQDAGLRQRIQEQMQN
ncbi:MAG: DUF4168 domain-containing protein [Elainella sp.]